MQYDYDFLYFIRAGNATLAKKLLPLSVYTSLHARQSVTKSLVHYAVSIHDLNDDETYYMILSHECTDSIKDLMKKESVK
jgi:hypothetical protein